MKTRKILWMLAAILVYGVATMFTSCSNSDNPVDPAENLSEKIVGKWIFAERNGEPTPTNKKRVFYFVSSTKAYVSISRGSKVGEERKWLEHTEAEVAISGNKVTLTMHSDEQTTLKYEFIITTIDDTEFIAALKVSATVDGKEERNTESDVCLKRVTTDYREAILGTWEGHSTSERSVFDDVQEHRWEYKADGTYVYYIKDGDNWVPGDNSLNEYFLFGNLLCTRWVDHGQENREWWEISIAADRMNWTALRLNDDGTTFTATFEMKKVE